MFLSRVSNIFVIVILCCVSVFQSRASSVNYAEVRMRVSNAFAEKSHEIAQAIDVVQTLSKESLSLLDKAKTQCGH